MRKPFLFLFLFLFLSVLVGCDEKSAPVTHHRVGHDVVDSTLSETTAVEFLSLVSREERTCDERIKKGACLSLSFRMGFDSKCAHGEVSEEIVQKLIALKDRLPDVHKQVFCHLERFQIHESLESIGYAGRIFKDEAKSRDHIGNFIGLRAEAVIKDLNPNVWSWKEQLNFGLTDPKDMSAKISDLGPRVEESITGGNDQLLHVMVHELTHVIDFMNRVTEKGCEIVIEKNDFTGFSCLTEKESFDFLSWPVAQYSFPYNEETQEFLQSPEDVQLYPALKQLCYYECKTPLSLDLWPSLMKELKASSFFTIYSASSRAEDFAESSMVYALAPRGFVYKVLNPDGSLGFSSEEATKSGRLDAKMQWLERFYSSKDLKLKM